MWRKKEKHKKKDTDPKIKSKNNESMSGRYLYKETWRWKYQTADIKSDKYQRGGKVFKGICEKILAFVGLSLTCSLPQEFLSLSLFFFLLQTTSSDYYHYPAPPGIPQWPKNLRVVWFHSLSGFPWSATGGEPSSDTDASRRLTRQKTRWWLCSSSAAKQPGCGKIPHLCEHKTLSNRRLFICIFF